MSCSQEPQGPRPEPLFSYSTKDVAFATSQLAETFEILFDLTPCLVEHAGFARYDFAKKLGNVYLAHRRLWVPTPAQQDMHIPTQSLEAWA